MSYFYWLFLKGNNFQRIESAAEIIKIIKVILQYWISAQDFYSTKDYKSPGFESGISHNDPDVVMM